MNVTNYGLRARPPKKQHYVMGSGKMTARLGAEAGEINPTGKWSKYAPTRKELQKRNGFETSNCTNFGTAKALIALAKFKGYEFPDDISERHTGVETGTTYTGNDPFHVIDVIAKKCGVVHDSLLPWTTEDSYETYYAPRPMTHDLRVAGQSVLRKTNIHYEWVFNNNSKISPQEKRELLKQALKRGTVCVSVRAWEKKGDVYTKKVGAVDGHWVWLPELDVADDQYEPYVKRLEENYDFNMAIVYFMAPNPTGALPQDKPLLLRLLTKLLDLLTWRG